MNSSHTSLHPDVKKLLTVQNVDQKIGALRKDLVSVPREREQREAKLESLRKRAADVRTAFKSCEQQMRSNEAGIRDSDQEIKKLQERLNVVKNNAEYQAILLQIESVKRQIGQQEEEGLALIERLETLTAELATADAAVADEQKVFDAFVQKANQILQDREAKVAELMVGRDELAAAVPAELLKAYERMFEARAHRVVCAVEGANCTGCYTSIPPNLQVKLRGGSSIVKCDSCQRILYYADDA